MEECFLSFLLLSLVHFLFVFSYAKETGAAQGDNNGVYIVYMGASTSPSGSVNRNAQLLGSVLRRKENGLVHTYRHGFSGFAARLSGKEARLIARRPGVLSVFPDPILQLHTTRSYEFLQYQTDVEIDSSSGSVFDQSVGSDTIIGILDTGIWPESESFNDKGMGPVPPRWKGICMEGRNFSSSTCNRKLIGARYYSEEDAGFNTARDTIGHGTHVASTAAGNYITAASYYGLAEGTAKSGSPGSRIAIYRVCTPRGCRGSAILAAFDDAIADGVDVLSLSLGASSAMPPQFSSDPIAIGAFHATEKGIMVVCSAGNDGPDPETVVNVAPWILTVAATTIDRDFESDVVLGNNKVVKGEGINFSNLHKTPSYPFIYGIFAKSNSSSEEEAKNCNPNSIDPSMIKGKIVLCVNTDQIYSAADKLDEIKKNGGLGLILVDDLTRSVPSTYGSFPMTVISSKDGKEILSYINSTRSPVATVLPTVTITNQTAPTVAFFSARGPSFSTKNLLKPDIAAPGVGILAAWIGNDSTDAPTGKDQSLFNVLSGTSMACPHVSGIAATIKSHNPAWNPSAIRSAIMTTATQTNNLKGPLTTDSGSPATPYDYGAGEIHPARSLHPGLVYEMNTTDYLQFLCNYGYDSSKIKLVASYFPEGFTCPKDSNPDLISNLNYPSIAVSGLKRNESKKVSRRVTNVGEEEETVYTVTVKAPSEVDVKVVPDALQFTKTRTELSYQVIYSYTGSSSSSPRGDLFGSITWTNGKYRVRSPFVVTSG